MKALTEVIFDFAAKVAPGERADWVSAMRTELEFSPPVERLRFASGCVGAALVWRFWTPKGVENAAQGLLVAVSATLAMVATLLTLVAGLEGDRLVMAIPAVAWGLGAFTAARWGLRGMMTFAISGTALSGALLLAWAAGSLQPSLLVRALALEAVVILAAFVCLTVFARILATRMERSA